MSQMNNNHFGLQPHDIKTILAILRQHPEVAEAIMFGSRAKGNYKRGSDVDIALKGSRLTHRTVATIGDTLNEETIMPYHFDLLNHDTISNPDLLAHIERVGICFYRKSEDDGQNLPG
jgi:uncharacterized protein